MLAAVSVVGCGSARAPGPSSPRSGTGFRALTAPSGTGAGHAKPPSGAGAGRSPASSGAAVFAQACSSCHSLLGNESRHLQGGDLLGYGFSRQVLTQYTMEMPLRRALAPAEVDAVVGYVLTVERSRRVAGGRAG